MNSLTTSRPRPWHCRGQWTAGWMTAIPPTSPCLANTRFFQKPSNVFMTVRAKHRDSEHGEPLALECCDVDTKGCGIDNCLIFHPLELSKAAGKQSAVTVANVTTHDNEPRSIRFRVKFIDR